jgi:hypothetical protein
MIGGHTLHHTSGEGGLKAVTSVFITTSGEGGLKALTSVFITTSGEGGLKARSRACLLLLTALRFR